MTTHAPLPLQSPLQPANVWEKPGVGVRATWVPSAKLAEHVDPQLIPAGLLVTVPDPVPFFATVNARVTGTVLNVAVTDRVWLIATTHAPVPLQAPLQPANVEPEAGVGVRVTWVPSAKLAEQVGPQLIPAGELVTVPDPVPVLETVNARVTGTALNVAVTDRV